jgi:hypothetical protein
MQQNMESDPDPAPPAADRQWRPYPRSDPGLLFLLGRGEWTSLKARDDRVGYCVETPGGCFFVKHYRPRRLTDRFRDFAVRRKPQRAFRCGLRLAKAGVGTPRPAGLFVVGRWVFHEALLVNEWLGRERKWSHHLTRAVPRCDFPDEFRQGVLALARLLGGLHRLERYHGDLSSNLLFAGEQGQEIPYLIDLEDLHRRLSRKRRVKNLEELGRSVPDLKAISLRDRWLFLTAYAAAAGLDREEARKLWREGRAAQIRRHARNAKRQGA